MTGMVIVTVIVLIAMQRFAEALDDDEWPDA